MRTRLEERCRDKRFRRQGVEFLYPMWLGTFWVSRLIYVSSGARLGADQRTLTFHQYFRLLKPKRVIICAMRGSGLSLQIVPVQSVDIVGMLVCIIDPVGMLHIGYLSRVRYGQRVCGHFMDGLAGWAR